MEVDNLNVNSTTGSFSEECLQICPLCESLVKWYFINFKEKLLMCENSECEFPFGHEDPKIVELDHEMSTQDDVYSSTRIRRNATTTVSSMTSSSNWADIEKINRVLQSDETDTHAISEYNMRLKESEKDKQYNKKLLQNVEDLQKLSKSLTKDDLEDRSLIKNEKLLKHLMHLQKVSGQQLLKDKEINILKKVEPDISIGELKINIEPSENRSESSIKIEITNRGNMENKVILLNKN